MTVRSIVARGQTAKDRLMIDEGTLRRPAGMSDPDIVTGVVTPLFTELYEGRATVKPIARGFARKRIVGEIDETESMYIVELPISVIDVTVGDIWTTTAADDPALLTDPLRVVGVEDSSRVTARRLICSLVETRRQP